MERQITQLEQENAALKRQVEELKGEKITHSKLVKCPLCDERNATAVTCKRCGKIFLPKVTDEEVGDFQEKVRSLVIDLSGAPDSAIDGKGSDAGWQEFTLTEISQGFAHLIDKQESTLQPIREALETSGKALHKVRCWFESDRHHCTTSTLFNEVIAPALEEAQQALKSVPPLTVAPTVDVC